jgi:uncharacterized phage protein gp47/JayE
MAIPTDKIYTPATAAEIRDDFLTDVRLEARKYADEDEVDRITRPGTDWFIFATAMGNLGLLQYSNITKASTNANILTATGDSLDDFREALGLPLVNASPSSGRIVVTVQPSGALANFNNHELVLPNGKRAKVDGVHIGVADQGEVPVITIDTGSDCNLAANNIVRFVSPPPNVQTNAKVSVNSPLTGGTDEETDERKRDRILNRLQTVPAGGNWGYCIEQAMNALGTVQYAFVYPALGGPGSSKVVVVKDIDPDLFDFSRALSAQATAIVRDALHATMPDEMEIVVASAASQNTDVALRVSIPEAALAGGNGLGWYDATPWPEFGAAPTAITAISADGRDVTLNTPTIISPTAGQTRIAWWSSVDQAFKIRLVTSILAAVPGAWQLRLDQPLFDHNNSVAAVGDYVSPAAVNMVAYGTTWRGSMRRLGPGENTSDANRIPRALRRPFIADDWNCALTVKQLVEMSEAHDEINDIAWAYRSLSTPTVPASVATAPNVLVSRHFGVYKL